MKKIITIFGTRPEAIKLYKIINLLNDQKNIKHMVCVTGQHKQLLNQTLKSLNLKYDINLNVMKKGQSLSSLNSKIIDKISKLLHEENPDLIIVHGDTATAFAASLAAFYSNIKVAHVEAGLRTYDLKAPFPEELNRTLIAKLATYHFAPMENNKQNLLKEGIQQDSIIVTGNTVIDTLLEFSSKNYFPKNLNKYKKYLKNYILVTGHRRENFGKGFIEICDAIKKIAEKYSNYNIIYPVHLNPNVKNVVEKYLSNYSNIFLLEPQPYLSFIFLMKNCHFILTDSGGIQEEAPSLNKPVLLMRDSTERMEAITSGSVKLVGSSSNKIFEESSKLIEDNSYYHSMINHKNPYGDGKSSEKIINYILNT